MKKVGALFIILFLVVAAAGVLTFSAIFSDSHFQLKYDTHFGENVKLSSFNEALLTHASVDITEPMLKQEIDKLLQGNFSNYNRYERLNVNLRSPEFHQVWLSFRKHLEDWSRKRRFQDDIMFDLMKVVKGLRGESIMGLLSGKKKYSSCAVVGNSGILLKSVYGELIDNHEVVIRLNNARIKTFEKNVGKKTSISFMNSNILNACARREDCFCHQYGINVPIALYICQPSHFLDYIKCNSSSSHKASLIITDPRFDVLCDRIVKYYSMKRFISLTGKGFEDWIVVHDGMAFHYSSGMQAVMLAVSVCDKVSIFGFGKSDDAKHHYHTNQRSELGLHDYEAEYNLYRDLESSPDVIPFISDKFKFPPVCVYH